MSKRHDNYTTPLCALALDVKNGSVNVNAVGGHSTTVNTEFNAVKFESYKQLFLCSHPVKFCNPLIQYSTILLTNILPPYSLIIYHPTVLQSNYAVSPSPLFPRLPPRAVFLSTFCSPSVHQDSSLVCSSTES